MNERNEKSLTCPSVAAYTCTTGIENRGGVLPEENRSILFSSTPSPNHCPKPAPPPPPSKNDTEDFIVIKNFMFNAKLIIRLVSGKVSPS